MRIAYFTDTYLPQINGVSNTLEKLSNYLSEREIQHMLFAPQYGEDMEDPESLQIARFRSVSLPFYPECRLSIPRFGNLSRIADKFKPDIVHLTDPLGIGLAGLRYARDKDIPIVSSFHTNFDAYLKYYNLEYLEGLVWGLFKWFHGFSAINFCPSHDTMQVLASKEINNLRIWSRGIDTEKFTPNLRSIAVRQQLHVVDQVVFLYVGRLAAEKDLDILLQSIKIVNTSHAEKVKFVFVGDGPYAQQMKESSYENVVFTGYLKGEDLAAMYASCDVFAFPSSTETFGNVVLEAMASGLPVIAVNSGGVKDNVLNNYTGLMCPPRDADSFAQAIIQLADNKRLIKTLAVNAREYAATKSWSWIFDQLISAYQSVIDNHQTKLIKIA